jgi:hypothetical protein
MIIVTVNVTKIDREKLKRDERGVFCDFILFDRPGKYDDGFVVQGVSKEEREAGIKGPIVGNWKETNKKKAPPEPWQPTIKQPPPEPQKELLPENDDIPF